MGRGPKGVPKNIGKLGGLMSSVNVAKGRIPPSTLEVVYRDGTKAKFHRVPAGEKPAEVKALDKALGFGVAPSAVYVRFDGPNNPVIDKGRVGVLVLDKKGNISGRTLASKADATKFFASVLPKRDAVRAGILDYALNVKGRGGSGYSFSPKNKKLSIAPDGGKRSRGGSLATAAKTSGLPLNSVLTPKDKSRLRDMTKGGLAPTTKRVTAALGFTNSAGKTSAGSVAARLIRVRKALDGGRSLPT